MRGLMAMTLALIFALSSTILTTALVYAQATETPLVTVSSTDPYANCSNAGQPGKNYPDAEVEPQVAVNPHSADNIIGVWQQDRWSNGGAHGLLAGFSTDGGKTWGESQLPFSGCAHNPILDPFTGAPYNRASDPWVSIGPDGTAYTVGLLATNTNAGVSGGNNDTGVATLTSTDSGASWDNPRLIKSDQGSTPIFEATHFFNDKESITADPIHAGTAYVVWDRLVEPSHSVDAILNSRAIRGPTWFSKTTDGGKTWTGTRAIFDPGQNAQTIGNLLVVDPRTDVLYDFFELLQFVGPKHAFLSNNSVAFVSSSDGGTTWSQPTTVAAQQTANDTDPNTGAAIRTGGGLPEVAIDASNGNLYVVWEDARFTGGTVNQVVISTSANGGTSWSTPARVSTVTGRPAFTPTVAVNSAGVVGVTYYDLRNLPAGDTTTLPTDYWFTSSTDHGATFGNETHIAGSFDMLKAPNAGGFFVGDYEALGVNGAAFLPFFVQAEPSSTTPPPPPPTSSPTDVFTNSITP
jgi:hypothetical protein